MDYLSFIFMLIFHEWVSVKPIRFNFQYSIIVCF